MVFVEQRIDLLDQWNGMESTLVDPHKYRPLIFDKDVKAIQWRKKNLFNKWCRSNFISLCQKKERMNKWRKKKEGRKEGA